MRRFTSKLVAFGMMALLGASAAQAENNPLYESWAKHGPGTSIKVKMVSEAAGNKTEMETVQTLKEVTPEKAVVETKMTMSMMGQTMEQPAQTMDIPAKADAEQMSPEQAVAKAKEEGMDVKESEETVTVAGKSVKAKVYEAKGNQQGMDMWSKVWTSPDVPGMMVRMESKTEGAMASNSTMELVEMDLK